MVCGFRKVFKFKDARRRAVVFVLRSVHDNPIAGAAIGP